MGELEFMLLIHLCSKGEKHVELYQLKGYPHACPEHQSSCASYGMF